MGDSPVTINVAPYTKEQNVQLLTQYLILNHSADLKNVEMEEAEDFFTNFSDMILGTFRAVCRTLPQLIRLLHKSHTTVEFLMIFSSVLFQCGQNDIAEIPGAS